MTRQSTTIAGASQRLAAPESIPMATHINGVNLDDASFFPVYAKCEALKLPIFLHPTNAMGSDRTRSDYLSNFLGNPYDTGVAAASLMFGGVLDAFPQLDVVESLTELRAQERALINRAMAARL